MSRYAEAHKEPQGPGDQRPTAKQIIDDEGVKGKLVGKVIVITGTSSGIGIETARALSLTGARLFLTARDLEKARTALDGILQPERVELLHMDQRSFGSVRKAASEILEKSDNKVNILINNAGIMAVPELTFTDSGHETQFTVNHLSHFLFFELLEPALLANASSDFSSRVINLTSSGHNMQELHDSNNYNFEKGDYNGMLAYAQSKTANIYMSNAIERKYGSQGLHANAVHPGNVPTGLARYFDQKVLALMQQNTEVMRHVKSVEQGAATTVWAAIGKEWEHKGGEYLADCGRTSLTTTPGSMMAVGYAPWAFDVEKEDRLWEDSLRLVGLQQEAKEAASSVREVAGESDSA